MYEARYLSFKRHGGFWRKVPAGFSLTQDDMSRHEAEYVSPEQPYFAQGSGWGIPEHWTWVSAPPSPPKNVCLTPSLPSGDACAKTEIPPCESALSSAETALTSTLTSIGRNGA